MTLLKIQPVGPFKSMVKSMVINMVKKKRNEERSAPLRILLFLGSLFLVLKHLSVTEIYLYLVIHSLIRLIFIVESTISDILKDRKNMSDMASIG